MAAVAAVGVEINTTIHKTTLEMYQDQHFKCAHGDRQ